MSKLIGKSWRIKPNQNLVLTRKDDFKIIAAQLSNSSNTNNSEFLVMLRGEIFLNNTPLPRGSSFVFIEESSPQVVNKGQELEIHNIGNGDIVLHMSFEDMINGEMSFWRDSDAWLYNNQAKHQSDKIKQLEDDIAELVELEDFCGDLPEFLSNKLNKRRKELRDVKGEQSNGN